MAKTILAILALFVVISLCSPLVVGFMLIGSFYVSIWAADKFPSRSTRTKSSRSSSCSTYRNSGGYNSTQETSQKSSKPSFEIGYLADGTAVSVDHRYGIWNALNDTGSNGFILGNQLHSADGMMRGWTN